MSHLRTCLLQSKSLSVKVLLNALHSLINLQQHSSSLSPEDVMRAVTVHEGFSQNDIHLYATILVEVALVRQQNNENREILQLNLHYVSNEATFLQAVIECMYANSFGESLPVVDNFIVQTNLFMESRSQIVGAESSRRSSPPSNNAEEAEDFRIALERIKIQKQESIGRLLAQFRKFGMEILFPQVVYDKVNGILCFVQL
jgi:hypothetical protein